MTVTVRSMRIVFMGSPKFALPVLQSLIDDQNDIAGIYTQPDKPSGRGNKISAPAVKLYANDLGFLVKQPISLKDPKIQNELSELQPELIVVAAYGKLIPKGLLEIPRYGCWNIHPSLLPKYRGASPVTTAILSGETTTGVTLMQLDEGLDTGPIISQQAAVIGTDESALECTERLFKIGAEILIKNLPNLLSNSIVTKTQSESSFTITKLLTKKDGLIKWNSTAEHIIRMERAYRPWPGIYTTWNGKILKIHQLKLHKDNKVSKTPGKVAKNDGKLVVHTARGSLVLCKLQLEGRDPVSGNEFISGYPDLINSILK